MPDFSRRVVDAVEAAATASAGWAVMDGQMVDWPTVLRARRVLERGKLA